MNRHLYSTARLAALCCVLIATSCQTTQNVNSDPVVVAEKTTQIALDTFDTFLRIEYDNRATLQKISPDIHKYAEFIRVNGPRWLETARGLTKAYKNNRTPENAASLQTAIAVLQEAITQSQQYMAKANSP